MNDVEKVQEIIKDHTLDDERRFAAVSEDLQEIKGSIQEILAIYRGMGFIGKFFLRTGMFAAAATAIAGAIYMFIHLIRGTK